MDVDKIRSELPDDPCERPAVCQDARRVQEIGPIYPHAMTFRSAGKERARLGDQAHFLGGPKPPKELQDVRCPATGATVGDDLKNP
jgi:hypothetical protein